jgi:uncharacterized membrane protein
MKSIAMFFATICVAVGLVTFAINPGAIAARYSVIDLGVPARVDFSEGIDVNELGQVAVRTWASGYFYAFLWDHGVQTVVDTTYQYNSPAAINILGQIVGEASSSASVSHGLLWNQGTATYLGHSPGGQDWTRAEDINDQGLIVGYSLGDPNNQRRAITWQNGVWTDYGVIDVGFDPNGTPDSVRYGSEAISVNNAGQILGVTRRYAASQTMSKAWKLSDGQVTVLPAFDGDQDASIFPIALNEHGDVLAGYFSSLSGYLLTVWDGSGIHMLQQLPSADNSAVADLNDLGSVVGTSVTFGAPNTSPTYQATIWNRAGIPNDLNALLDESGNGWLLERANAINNQGWIVGQGVNAQGKPRGFLLIPIPEPSSAAIVCFGLIGAALCKQRGRTTARRGNPGTVVSRN